jgi:hypothetical protein
MHGHQSNDFKSKIANQKSQIFLTPISRAGKEKMDRRAGYIPK